MCCSASWSGWQVSGYCAGSRCGSAGLYPLAIVSLAVVSYAGASVLAARVGFAAVYVTSLMLGRAELPHRIATRSFVDGFAWLAQIGLFVMLGLLATPSRIGLDDVGIALVIGFAVTVVARFARGVRCRRRRSGCRGESRRSSAGRGCAVPCRSCSPRSRCRTAYRKRTDLRHRLRAGAAVHTVAGSVTAVAGETARRDGRHCRARGGHGHRAAGDARRGHAAGQGTEQSPGWPAWRSASCGCRKGCRSHW